MLLSYRKASGDQRHGQQQFGAQRKVNPDERALLEAAADELIPASASLCGKSLEAAELDLLNRNIVTIPAEDWEALRAGSIVPPGEPRSGRLGAQNTGLGQMI